MLGLLFSCLLAGAASASPLYLTPPASSFISYGAGATRGDIVTTSANFDLTSIGIQAQIDNGSAITFNAYVWSSSGSVGSAPLATGAAIQEVGDGTLQFYDLPIAYTLVPGQEYDIGIAFNNFNVSGLQINYYSFAYPDASFTVAPITVYDGEESYNGPNNSLTPYLRLNGTASTVSTVPEPASLLLLGTGLVGLRASRRRRG